MEPQIEVYCKKDKKKDCSCLETILFIISIALSFFVGALVAALTGFVTTLGTGAVIVLIIALAILLLSALISLLCCKKTDKKKNCCC